MPDVGFRSAAKRERLKRGKEFFSHGVKLERRVFIIELFIIDYLLWMLMSNR
jgi:hypothetical protein